MMDSAINNQLREILSNPHFVHNIRGRLAALLRILDDRLQKNLSCDYAEHVVWICEDVLGRDERCQQAIDVVRQFLLERIAIEHVAQARTHLLDAHYELRHHTSPEARDASEASWAVVLALQVCCQRQLESIGAIVASRHQPTVIEVVSQASYAIARYTGGQHSESLDSKQVKEAKKRGKVAAKAETEWQLAHLLEVAGLGGKAS